MQRPVRANSPKHKILEALSATNKTTHELAEITGQERTACLNAVTDLMESGFISRVSGHEYTITMFGVDEYAMLGKVRLPVKYHGKKAESRTWSTSGELRDKYNLDLSRITCREGALDFLNHPSVYGGVRKERK